MIVFENNTEYLLAFISAIFGLSIPVMLQVIERVDQRYESTRLAGRLKTECSVRICIVCLIISLVTCTYALFIRVPSPWDYWLLNNSADLIALLSCVLLIVFFLLSCRIILTYYNPENLQDRILTEFDKAHNDKEKERAFLDWVDLTKVLLQASDREPAFKVYDTIGKEIYKAFDASGNADVSFPTYLTRGITSINENLCQMRRRPFSINNGNQLLKDLISQPTKLSDDAFRVLWNNLQLQLFYGQENWIYEYWSAAVQIYDFYLTEIHKGVPALMDAEQSFTEDDVKLRHSQRNRFLEFHITLCASILQERRYDLLEKILSYIRVWPPEYPLVPSSHLEVLTAFRMIEESPRYDMGIESYYPMVGMKGIIDGVVLGSVKRYLAFLYIRSFTNIGKKVNIYTVYPDSLGGLKKMAEDIDFILHVLPSILKNEELMRVLSFDDPISLEGCINKVLGDILTDISIKQKEIREIGPQDADLVAKSIEEVKGCASQRLSVYNPFMNEKHGDSLTTYYLRGNSCNYYPNEAFQHDSGISYVGMAENVTGISVGDIEHGFASVFYMMKQRVIKISSEFVFDALNRLEITQGFSIISFDIYWNYYLHKKIDGLEIVDGQLHYKGALIISLQGGPTDLVSQTIFVMRNNDLPALTFIRPRDKDIARYKLRNLDDTYMLYASILQLSQNEELLDDVKDMSRDDARKHSIFSVFINARMIWKPSSPMVGIKLMHNMKDNGSIESIETIDSFEKMFGNESNEKE